MEEQLITFNGSNEKLFSRTILEKVNAKTTLIVPETHNAILVKDGQMLQTLSSGRYFVSQFVDLRNEQDAKLEILFMSKTAKLKLLWGTASKLLMWDSVVETNYHLGMSGDFEVQISDPRKCYLFLIGMAQDLTADALQERLMSNVLSVLENVVVEFISKKEVIFSQISLHKKEISKTVLQNLSKKLSGDYGIAVFSFNIANIIIDDEDLSKMSTLYHSKQMLKCPKCGQVMSEKDKFCSTCGYKNGGGKSCPSCEAENSDSAKFCSTCGTKLN